jgi:hypothetical protein
MILQNRFEGLLGSIPSDGTQVHHPVFRLLGRLLVDVERQKSLSAIFLLARFEIL